MFLSKNVLSAIARQGGFLFSYSADLIPGDSIVSFSAFGQSARKVLHSVRGGKFQFKEAGRFVIIQRIREERYGYITGRVPDAESRLPVDYLKDISCQSKQIRMIPCIRVDVM